MAWVQDGSKESIVGQQNHQSNWKGPTIQPEGDEMQKLEGRGPGSSNVSPLLELSTNLQKSAGEKASDISRLSTTKLAHHKGLGKSRWMSTDSSLGAEKSSLISS